MRIYEIIEAAGIRRPKPPAGAKPPLTPEQSQRASERKAGVQRQMRDEAQRHGQRVADLRDRLNQTP